MGVFYRTDKPLQKYSYSGVNCYEQCAFKYYLQYIKKHYIYVDTLAADFGTLCHYILENIGLDLKNGKKPDYKKYKDVFKNINIPKKDAFDKDGGIYGLEVLKKKYPREFFEADENGNSFLTKSEFFMKRGMYRLEEFLDNHPGFKVWACEKYFDITFNNHRFGGFIDRVLYNEDTGEYIIEDIKTKDKPFKDEELITPLQFVIYVKALMDITGAKEDKIKCAYDLPICDKRQDAGTKGYLKRGETKLNKIFNGIESGEWKPGPSPLCWWCQFNHGNPNIPKAGKGLCPYYSLWRPDNKTREVANLWEGLERHEIIVKRLDMSEKDCIIDLDF